MDRSERWPPEVRHYVIPSEISCLAAEFGAIANRSAAVFRCSVDEALYISPTLAKFLSASLGVDGVVELDTAAPGPGIPRGLRVHGVGRELKLRPFLDPTVGPRGALPPYTRPRCHSPGNAFGIASTGLPAMPSAAPTTRVPRWWMGSSPRGLSLDLHVLDHHVLASKGLGEYPGLALRHTSLLVLNL